MISPIYITGSDSNIYVISVSDTGVASLVPAPEVESFLSQPFILLNDTATSTTWKITAVVSASNPLQYAPTAYDSTQANKITGRTPSGYFWGIQIVNGAMQVSTAVPSSNTPTPYRWLTKSAAISQLQGRLYSSNFWSSAELWLYITEALRVWNALTEQWNVDLAISNANGGWINTGDVAASPRLRSMTDAALYSQMQYMLLEPSTGAETWTGTAQFSLTDLKNALQKRTQEVIQETACNLTMVTVASTPNVRRFTIHDTILQPRRIRFIDASGNKYTLTREDTQAFQYFEPSYLQSVGTPSSWSMVSESPLTIDVDQAPNVPGYFEVVGIQATASFTPPTASPLGVPDDWSWLPMYGALADVLSREPESTDKMRASYCLQRYTEGLEMMRNSNWMLQATIDGVSTETPALQEMDAYSPEWQQSSTVVPSVVQDGIDFVCPTTGTNQSVGMTLVGNAPLLDSTGMYVQVSRDDWSAVIGYANHAASFKEGGQDFTKTSPMLQDFYRAAAAVNKRLLTYGIFVDVLRGQGQKQEMQEIR